VWRSRRAAAAFILVMGVLNLPLSLPILPAGALHTVPLQKIDYNLGENIGWPELVASVARVYRSIPASERRSVVIVTGNYGEAGALNRYGAAFGLPGAFSGHNSFWWWGPPRPSTGIAIMVGYADQYYPHLVFRQVALAARIHNAARVENDEDGEPVWLCRDQRVPWPAVWSQFQIYG
jgi:hypothetical protein